MPINFNKVFWLPILSFYISFSSLVAPAQPRNFLFREAAKSTPDAAVEQNMFQLLNQDRVRRGLPALKWNQQLQEAARKHSELLAQRKQLSHQFPGEADLMHRISDTGLHLNAAAENLAYSTDSDELHPSLMRSPGHRANILSPLYDEVGIGVIRIDGKFFATQDFASVIRQASASQAEKRLAAAFNKLRADRRMPSVTIEADAAMTAAMCDLAHKDRVSAASIPRPSATRMMVAFTASEPEELPARLIELSGAPDLKKLFAGACFATSPNYPGGIYWFGVAY
jgi:uncharacterized protein YkwD